MELTTNMIVAIIVALGGGAGLATVLTVLFQRKKYAAEADSIRAENERVRSQNEQTEMAFIKNSLIEMQEMYKKEIAEMRETNKKEMAELRESNSKLYQEIEQLNKKISTLMNWIYGDNSTYRDWLEQKLHEYNPDIVFPDRPEPPSVFGNDNVEE
jgi:cell division protein FtsB